jgi:hypothetical protein
MRPSRIQLCLLAIWLVVSNLPAPALAHDPAFYFPVKWADSTAGWRFTPNFPTNANKRARVQESFQTWTDVANSAMTFNKNADATTGYTASNPCSSAATYNGIFYNTTVSFGTTYLCFTQPGPTYFLARFAMVIEDKADSAWNDGGTDTGTHVFKSVVTHEAGHAAGFGTRVPFSGNPNDQHFPVANDSTGICWDDSDFNTMCNGLNPVPAKTSTLEEHDLHTFQDAY